MGGNSFRYVAVFTNRHSARFPRGISPKRQRSVCAPHLGVAFTPDGKAVLTGSGDKTARLWHLDDQDLVRIACAALSRDLTTEG